MSLDNHLIHTCTIENPANGGVNAYNNAVEAYGTPVTDVRCRLVEKRETLWNDERQESTVVTVYLLMVAKDTTILERAKVSSVTLEDGTTTISDKFVVKELLARRGRSLHHQTAMLERVS